MPWQGQLFIGEPVATRADVRAIFKKLGFPTEITDEQMDDKDPTIETTVEVGGKTYTVSVEIGLETEDGSDTILDEADTDDLKINGSYAYVGFALTGRYSPKIMDRDYQHGRIDPFVIDLDEVNTILEQTRVWWPDAKLFLCDCFY